jgi:2-amino-4-hydroxy-6-hydroxymethyldihydropteridine diphosphokinase
MARVFVGVGSNINAASNIRSAIRALRCHYPELKLSSVYESEAVGFTGDNFYNLVVSFDSDDDDVFMVAAVLRSIEDEHGRDRRGPRFSSRSIDLDLLLYDDLILDQNGINIPRDEIMTNAFVLQPLAEIAGELVHPQTGQAFAEIWNSYPKEKQALWPIEFAWE